MRPPLRHANLVDRRSTTPAGQIRPAVNVEVILRVAFVAIRLAIPTDARAFMFYPREQRLPHRLMQQLCVIIRQEIDPRRRVNAGAEKRFIGIDIAHAAKNSCSNSSDLIARFRPCIPARKPSGVKSSLNGSGPKWLSSDSTSSVR